MPGAAQDARDELVLKNKKKVKKNFKNKKKVKKLNPKHSATHFSP